METQKIINLVSTEASGYKINNEVIKRFLNNLNKKHKESTISNLINELCIEFGHNINMFDDFIDLEDSVINQKKTYTLKNYKDTQDSLNINKCLVELIEKTKEEDVCKDVKFPYSPYTFKTNGNRKIDIINKSNDEKHFSKFTLNITIKPILEKVLNTLIENYEIDSEFTIRDRNTEKGKNWFKEKEKFIIENLTSMFLIELQKKALIAFKNLFSSKHAFVENDINAFLNINKIELEKYIKTKAKINDYDVNKFINDLYTKFPFSFMNFAKDSEIDVDDNVLFTDGEPNYTKNYSTKLRHNRIAIENQIDGEEKLENLLQYYMVTMRNFKKEQPSSSIIKIMLNLSYFLIVLFSNEKEKHIKKLFNLFDENNENKINDVVDFVGQILYQENNEKHDKKNKLHPHIKEKYDFYDNINLKEHIELENKIIDSEHNKISMYINNFNNFNDIILNTIDSEKYFYSFDYFCIEENMYKVGDIDYNFEKIYYKKTGEKQLEDKHIETKNKVYVIFQAEDSQTHSINKNKQHDFIIDVYKDFRKNFKKEEIKIDCDEIVECSCCNTKVNVAKITKESSPFRITNNKNLSIFCRNCHTIATKEKEDYFKTIHFRKLTGDYCAAIKRIKLKETTPPTIEEKEFNLIIGEKHISTYEEFEKALKPHQKVYLHYLITLVLYRYLATYYKDKNCEINIVGFLPKDNINYSVIKDLHYLLSNLNLKSNIVVGSQNFDISDTKNKLEYKFTSGIASLKNYNPIQLKNKKNNLILFIKNGDDKSIFIEYHLTIDNVLKFGHLVISDVSQIDSFIEDIKKMGVSIFYYFNLIPNKFKTTFLHSIYQTITKNMTSGFDSYELRKGEDIKTKLKNVKEQNSSLEFFDKIEIETSNLVKLITINTYFDIKNDTNYQSYSKGVVYLLNKTYIKLKEKDVENMNMLVDTLLSVHNLTTAKVEKKEHGNMITKNINRLLYLISDNEKKLFVIDRTELKHKKFNLNVVSLISQYHHIDII